MNIKNIIIVLLCPLLFTPCALGMEPKDQEHFSHAVMENIDIIRLKDQAIYSAKVTFPSGEIAYLASEPIFNEKRKNEWEMYKEATRILVGDRDVLRKGIGMAKSEKGLQKVHSALSEIYFPSDSKHKEQFIQVFDSYVSHGGKEDPFKEIESSITGMDCSIGCRINYMSKRPVTGLFKLPEHLKLQDLEGYISAYDALIMLASTFPTLGLNGESLYKYLGLFNPLSMLKPQEYKDSALPLHAFSINVWRLENPQKEVMMAEPDSNFVDNSHNAPDTWCEPPVHTLFTCINISEEDWQKLDHNVKNFLNTLSISPAFNNLLEDVRSQHGFINLCFSDQTSTNAKWTKAFKRITVNTSLLNNTLNFSEALLWELCNASNQFLDFPVKLSRDADSYAFLTEAAEHMSALRRNSIIVDYLYCAREVPDLKSTIEQMGQSTLDDLLYSTGENRTNFMDYWHHVNQKELGYPVHAQLYRDDYRSFFPYGRQGPLQAFAEADQHLIVYAFSQRSFDLAKKEVKTLSQKAQELGGYPDEDDDKFLDLQ